jgi:mono/diheme cytochrome c family protein
MKPHSNLAAVLSVWIIAVAPAAADTATGQDGATSGKTVYDKTCAACHRADPTVLATEPDQVAKVLQSKTVSAHHFKLTDAQIKDLVDYLAASKK